MVAIYKKPLIPLLLLVSILAFITSAAAALSTWPVLSDFTKFYASAQQYTQGQDMYAEVPFEAYGPLPAGFVVDGDALAGNMNPPQVTLLLLPLTALPIRIALQVWVVLSLALGIAGCMVLWFSLNSPPRLLAGLLWLLCAFLVYYPTLLALQLGQLTFLTFLLLALAWREMRKDHKVAVGLLLGLAVSIKIFIGLVIVYFLIRRQWRIVVWASVVVVGTTLLGIVAAGWESYVRYGATLGVVSWHGSGMNASFGGLFYRFFGGSLNEPLLQLPVLSQSLTYISAAACFGVLAWLAWPRTAQRHAQTDALGIGLAFAFALLISPLGWSYYFPILLVGIYPAWKENFYGSRAARRLTVAALIVSALPLPRIFLVNMRGPGALLYSSINFVALVAFAAGLAFAYRACRKHAGDQDAALLTGGAG